MKLDYIRYDEDGYPYNSEYPPQHRPWEKYDGYDNPVDAVFYYDYAVQGYNIDFNYRGEHYTLMGWLDGFPIALLDADDNEIQRFSDPADALRRCEIGGRRLLDIMEEFTDMECG